MRDMYDVSGYEEKEYGLVLEGGGAKGAYEIGVWKGLNELGIKVTAVVGTSIGALNGALFAQGDLAVALELWENIKYSSIIKVEDDLMERMQGAKWREVPLHESGQQFLDIVRNRGLDITPLKQMISEMLDEEVLRNSEVDFGLCTFNVTDFKPMELMVGDIDEGQVGGYLLASSYLPVFKSEKIFGKRFLDGAFHSALPTTMLVDQGYKEIIEVRLNGVGAMQPVEDDSVNIIRIETGEDLGGVLEIRKDRIERSINLGYYDTLKVFQGLNGHDYYIDGPVKEASYLKEFLKLSRARVEHLITGLGGHNSIRLYKSKDRMVCEVLIPLIAKKLKLSTDASYEDIYYRVLEDFAKKLDVDQFKVYKLKSFRKACVKGFKALKDEEGKELLRNDNMVELAYWLGL